MDAATFLEDVQDRLRRDGAEVRTEMLPDGPALVGYRSKFKVAWLLTKVHLFTVVATTASVVTADALHRHTQASLNFAESQKGRPAGLQIGVAVIAVLAGDSVDPSGVNYARVELSANFLTPGIAWPAAVDLTSGATYRHEGRVMLGGMYARWIRAHADLALGRSA